MEIIKKLITSGNHGRTGGNIPKYIVIHDTGNIRKTADAMNHYIWLETHTNTGSSAHVFVDDHQAIQVIDYNTPAWHTGKLYVKKPKVPECTNFNSVAVEFCINADGNLTKTLSNLVDVTTDLMEELNIPIERVITHNMSSGKRCPSTFLNNPMLYKNFVSQIKDLTDFKPSQELLQALSYLEEQGVTNTPSYWLKNISKVNYLEELLINMKTVLTKANERR